MKKIEMKETELTNFDLKQIAESGQCFRMRPVAENGWSVISQGHYLEVFQEGQHFSFCCPPEEFPFWERYFDLDTDYGAFIASIRPEDSYLTGAAAAGSGIRILRQDLWEMMVTFLISQQKTIPKIREAVELLSEKYGSPLPGNGKDVHFAFPTPGQLGNASLEDFRKLRLGYRAKYLHRLCRDVLEGACSLEELAAMDYPAAMARLTGLYGIGEKVANCICLFALHHIGAFPVDTWIRQILMKYYYPQRETLYRTLPKSRLEETIIRDYFGGYTDCAGVMQQYIFYYERVVVNGRQTATAKD